jgi:DNA-binding CsgD family transcriptional regulator
LTPRQRELLETLTATGATPQRVAERCRIVLMSAEGKPNIEQASVLGVDRQRVRRWRRRWAESEERLSTADKEGVGAKDLKELILGVLRDEHRNGGVTKFSPEQVAAIIALACEPPGESGLPVSHWPPSELAREAVKRGIVESISPRQVDRFLARRASDHTSRSTG